MPEELAEVEPETTPQDSSSLENPSVAELAERIFALQLRIDALEGQIERVSEQADITTDIVDSIATEENAAIAEETSAEDDRTSDRGNETASGATSEGPVRVISPRREHAYFRKLW